MQREKFFFQDIPECKTYKIGSSGKPEVYIADSKKASGTAFPCAGDMITIPGGWSEPPTKEVHRYKTPGAYTVVAGEIPAMMLSFRSMEICMLPSRRPGAPQ